MADEQTEHDHQPIEQVKPMARSILRRPIQHYGFQQRLAEGEGAVEACRMDVCGEFGKRGVAAGVGG
jgi:hypothetical protein